MKSNEEVIREISNKEFWVGGNHTFLKDNNLIYVIADGEQTKRIAVAQAKICNQLALTTDKKVNYLIDLNKAGKSTPDARKQWRRISEDEKTNKVALFGIHPVALVLASFVMGVSKKKDMLFFKTKKEALEWINS